MLSASESHTSSFSLIESIILLHVFANAQGNDNNVPDELGHLIQYLASFIIQVVLLS